jgi:hypothetical protein
VSEQYWFSKARVSNMTSHVSLMTFYKLLIIAVGDYCKQGYIKTYLHKQENSAISEEIYTYQHLLVLLGMILAL